MRRLRVNRDRLFALSALALFVVGAIWLYYTSSSDSSSRKTSFERCSCGEINETVSCKLSQWRRRFKIARICSFVFAASTKAARQNTAAVSTARCLRVFAVTAFSTATLPQTPFAIESIEDPQRWAPIIVTGGVVKSLWRSAAAHQVAFGHIRQFYAHCLRYWS